MRAGGRLVPLGVKGANPRITIASANNSSRAFTGYVFAEVPPRFEWTLTALGRNLLEPAQAAYDSRD